MYVLCCSFSELTWMYPPAGLVTSQRIYSQSWSTQSDPSMSVSQHKQFELCWFMQCDAVTQSELHVNSTALTDNMLFTAAALIVKWSMYDALLLLFLFTVDLRCFDSLWIEFVSMLEVLVSRHPLMRVSTFRSCSSAGSMSTATKRAFFSRSRKLTLHCDGAPTVLIIPHSHVHPHYPWSTYQVTVFTSEIHWPPSSCLSLSLLHTADFLLMCELRSELLDTRI